MQMDMEVEVATWMGLMIDNLMPYAAPVALSWEIEGEVVGLYRG